MDSADANNIRTVRALLWNCIEWDAEYDRAGNRIAPKVGKIKMGHFINMYDRLTDAAGDPDPIRPDPYHGRSVKHDCLFVCIQCGRHKGDVPQLEDGLR